MANTKKNVETEINEEVEVNEEKPSVIEPKLPETKKEGFGAKVKTGAKKIINSKPAKVVCGVLLVVAGAVTGAAVVSKGGKNGEGGDIIINVPDGSDIEVTEF